MSCGCRRETGSSASAGAGPQERHWGRGGSPPLAVWRHAQTGQSPSGWHCFRGGWSTGSGRQPGAGIPPWLKVGAVRGRGQRDTDLNNGT